MVEDIAPYVNLLVEGPTDEMIGRRLLEHTGLRCGRVFGKRGKPMLLSQVGRYNQAARHTPWLVLVDLDRSADCAPPFVAAKLPHPSAAIRFRVAVRAAEAWLLADAEHIARFLSVPLARIPVNPDAELDPKATLIQIARRSRKRVIREELVPREGSGAKVGPGYAGRLIEFVAGADQMWRPDVAAQHSESLRRCIVSLQTLHGWQIG